MVNLKLNNQTLRPLYLQLSYLCVPVVLLLTAPAFVGADLKLLETHCGSCHNDDDAEGDFTLSALEKEATDANFERWLDALERVSALEMPPADSSELSANERQTLVRFLHDRLRHFHKQREMPRKVFSRRLNNREFENSVRDVLLLDDIGTNLPTDNLIGDSLHHGFDTHGETLGFSKFHLEQYLVAIRKILDATILTGEQPVVRRYEVRAPGIIEAHTRQNIARRERRGAAEGFDFLDPLQFAYLKDFDVVPTTGRYKISIFCTGKDRGLYDPKHTGMHTADPIRLAVRMGDRQRIFDLPDETVREIKLNEWLAAGSRLRFQHPTDGLRLRGNGNFKFQYAIAGAHIKTNDPERYADIVSKLKVKPGRRVRAPESWHNWVDHWRGPRPRIFRVVVEGPLYDTWPPRRHEALIGKTPKIEDAERILAPIAARAWRRNLNPGELAPILHLVQHKANELGTVEALKEGILAILVSPNFLLVNRENDSLNDRFAAKFSYFLESTIPGNELRGAVSRGQLNDFESVRAELKKRVGAHEIGPFLRAFPYAWLELNDINFMAPDPDRYHHYHRKRVSEDMVEEALHFFRHAVEENIPVTDLLAADYSFINADLAKVYQVNGVPQDSVFRRHTFADGRRGGLLGMGAFLTVTADSLSTSPIHRAIYVMENFLGIHPKPPPADVEITEPDVRQAKTIKEILEKHRSQANCAACHRRIDPFGYAFENFDPAGAWRDAYVVEKLPGDAQVADSKKGRKAATIDISIDASSEFLSGQGYQDIVGYRKFLLTEANRKRFVRCFVTKLLTYANGAEPERIDFLEVDRIVAVSAKHEYRMVETIAAVIDSPLFRRQ